MRRLGVLPSWAGEEEVQGMRRLRDLHSWAAEEPVQGMRRLVDLPSWAAEEPVQGVPGVRLNPVPNVADSIAAQNIAAGSYAQHPKRRFMFPCPQMHQMSCMSAHAQVPTTITTAIASEHAKKAAQEIQPCERVYIDFEGEAAKVADPRTHAHARMHTRTCT